jgi:hypothetical protein
MHTYMTYICTYIQTDRQTDRQTDIHTYNLVSGHLVGVGRRIVFDYHTRSRSADRHYRLQRL